MLSSARLWVDSGEALAKPRPMQHGHVQAVCMGPTAALLEEGPTSGCLTDYS